MSTAQPVSQQNLSEGLKRIRPHGMHPSRDAPMQLASLVSAAETRDALYDGLAAWMCKRPLCAGAGFFLANSNEDMVAGIQKFDNPALANPSPRSNLPIALK